METVLNLLSAASISLFIFAVGVLAIITVYLKSYEQYHIDRRNRAYERLAAIKASRAAMQPTQWDNRSEHRGNRE